MSSGVMEPRPAAGWYADPEEHGRQRYWTGEAWGEERRATPLLRTPAAFWRRAVALGIDVALWAVAAAGLVWIGGAVAGATGEDVAGVGSLVALPLYFALAEWSYGCTLGKRWLGIQVVAAEHEEMSFGRALGRQLARVLNNFLLGLGWWWAAWDAEGAAWHDKVARTRVVVAGRVPDRDVLNLSEVEARDARDTWTAEPSGTPSNAPTPAADISPAFRAAPRRIRLPVIAAALTAVALVAAGDWWLRNVEMSRLVEATEATETTMEQWQTETRDLFAEFDAVTNPDQARIDQLLRDFEAVAAARLGDLLEADAELGDASLLPWHRSIATAKARMLDHTEVWTDRLRAVAADATAFDDQIATAEISATLRIAHRSYQAAVPAVALYDLDARVEDIFDD